ncbi:MAG: anthranilate synthase component I, partial [Treponema sp.]|nr:anthranilate synthase component I [Treponema sp.]
MARTDSIYFSLPCDRYTPFSLARKIGASAILESASFARGRERYSILLLEPAFHIVQDDEGVAFLIDGRRLPYKGGNEAGETIAPGSRVLHKTDVLDALLYVASQNDLSKVHCEDGSEKTNVIPVPASGLGYLGYEFAARCDTITLAPQTDELHIPESEFIAGHIYVVFDHFTEAIHVFALNYNEHQIDLEKAVATLKKRLGDMDFTYLSAPEEACPVKT